MLCKPRRFHLGPGGVLRSLKRSFFILDERFTGMDCISDIYQDLVYFGSDSRRERNCRVLQDLPGGSDSCFKAS